MRNHFAVFLFLLTSVTSLADNSGPHWTEVRSPNFAVVTNAGEKDGRRVAGQLERMRSVFHVLMPSASDDAAAPIIVVALKDQKSFRALEPEAYLAKNQLDLAGLFLSEPNKNYILLRLDAQGDHPFATVYHEYTHYMLRKTSDWIPLWLNEGLAEFYQNATLQEKDVRLGEPSADDILYLRQNRLLPLATLLQADHTSPYYHDEQKGSVFYAQSWALTHYIEITDFDNKTNHLQTYSRLLMQHEDSLTAAQHTFGDLKKLEKDLNAYVGQYSFKEFRLLAPVPFPESAYTVRPMPQTEADAIRADVLLGVGRTKEAEALLASVLAADPKSALAHETMGDLKFREHDIPAATKWYGEAVELDSQSYLAHYYFAVMSLQTENRERDEAVEQSLRLAIKLNPKFAPAYDGLAQFYASRHERLDEAHGLNLMAVSLEPENLSYRLNAANVLMEDEKFDSAIMVLKAAKHLAKSFEEGAMVDRQIDQMESYQASVQRAQKERDQMVAQGSVTTSTEIHFESTRALVAPESKEPAFPDGAPMGPHHTVSGLIRGVKCAYPTILTLTLDRADKPVALYTNNYFKVVFTTANYNPTKDILPCNDIEGMKAKIEYGEVTDGRVAGQIMSIELSK